MTCTRIETATLNRTETSSYLEDYRVFVMVGENHALGHRQAQHYPER